MLAVIPARSRTLAYTDFCHTRSVDPMMADKPRKRRLHIGEGPDALMDSFHELRGSLSVPAFLNTLLEVYKVHV